MDKCKDRLKSIEKKRITVKLKRPNPLFEEWLKGWYDEAKTKNNNRKDIFEIALKSLRAYPLKLESGRQCKILNGFNDVLCVMLDRKLFEHHKQETSSSCVNFVKKPEQIEHATNLVNSRIDKNSAQTINHSYRPEFKSETFAILIALRKCDNTNGLNKTDLIRNSQIFCTDPIKCTSSIKELLHNNIIMKHGKPMRYILTEGGKALADSVEKDYQDEISKLCCSESTNFGKESCKLTSSRKVSVDKDGNQDTYIFTPHTFDIYLIIDTKETSGLQTSSEDEIVCRLRDMGVQFIVRNLKIGDFAFICRDKTSGKELILPYIIERKRIDDFGSSIKDGRFHEQKFRLKQSGIENLIYLIELFDTRHTGLPMTTLYQAAINTLVQDKFTIKFTQDVSGTAKYLFSLYSILNSTYLNKTLVSCPKENISSSCIEDELISLMTFTEFNRSASKTKPLTVSDMFVKHLLHIKGLSVDKTLAIVNRYKTPKQLKFALELHGEDAVLVQFGTLNKNIGPVLRRVLHMLYTREDF